jgi:hypothetical protein
MFWEHDRVEDVTFPLDDGSHLLILGLAQPAEDSGLDLPAVPDEEAQLEDHAEPDSTLGPVADFLADFLTSGVLYGTAGGAAWDLIKALASELRERGMLPERQSPTAAEVVQIIRDQAAAQGHSDVVIEEVIQHPGRGWQLRGHSGPKPLHAQMDPTGRVIHLRLGD